MKLWLGIDPGKSGGIAFIPEAGEPWAVSMPDTAKDLWECLQSAKLKMIQDSDCTAVLERVRSSPQMGVTSSFTFGRGYGQLEMALLAAGIRYEDVTPQKWQKFLGCLTGGDKNVSKSRAQQLFPSIKVTHAIADSLLIAEYARRNNL